MRKPLWKLWILRQPTNEYSQGREEAAASDALCDQDNRGKVDGSGENGVKRLGDRSAHKDETSRLMKAKSKRPEAPNAKCPLPIYIGSDIVEIAIERCFFSVHIFDQCCEALHQSRERKWQPPHSRKTQRYCALIIQTNEKSMHAN